MRTPGKYLIYLVIALSTTVILSACQTDGKKEKQPENMSMQNSRILKNYEHLTYNWKFVATDSVSQVQMLIDTGAISVNPTNEQWQDAFILGQDSPRQSTVFSVTVDCGGRTLRFNHAVLFDQAQGKGNPLSIKISNGDFIHPQNDNENKLIDAICPQPKHDPEVKDMKVH